MGAIVREVMNDYEPPKDGRNDHKEQRPDQCFEVIDILE